MAHVQTHKEAEKPRKAAPSTKAAAPETEKTTAPAIERWHHPIDLMRRMLAWRPFEAISPFELWREGQLMEAPDFDMKETDNSFVLKADLPGIEVKDLDIQLVNNRLTVSGSRAEETEKKGETYHITERAFGSFSRSFPLPAETDSDKVEADLTNGVLTITVPKLPGARPKQVEVKSS